MSQHIDIKRKIFAKNSFQNVIDTEFKQLITSTTTTPISVTTSIDKFFIEYNDLFYSIPPSGSNSHLDIVNRSSEYIGISLLDLEEEIRSLRAENISLKNQILTITNTKI